MHVIVHMFTGDLCRFSLIHCFMLFITSPLVVCADFHSRAQGRARIRKGGVFRAQHKCDTYGMEWTFELHRSGQGDGEGDRLNLCN